MDFEVLYEPPKDEKEDQIDWSKVTDFNTEILGENPEWRKLSYLPPLERLIPRYIIKITPIERG